MFKRQFENIQYAIVTNGAIVKSKLRRILPEMQKVVNEQLNGWLKDGVISRSDSLFGSCLYVVSKKFGKLRVCVDYRRLNVISLLEAYPFPWSPNFSSRGQDRDFLDLLRPKLETKKNKGLHFDLISDFTIFLPKFPT